MARKNIIPYDFNVFKFAEERGIAVMEQHFPPDQRGFLAPGKKQWIISVNRQDPYERKVFTVAHELGELEYMDNDEFSLDEKHHLANKYAAKLLLPESEIKNDVWNFDLLQLKDKYPYVSYEAIARRTLSFRNRILTIFDNRKVTCRIAPEGMCFPRKPAVTEIETADSSYKSKNTVVRQNETLKTEAYYIDENTGVIRVILFTELLLDY